MARNSFSFTVFNVDPAPQGSKKFVGHRTTKAGNSIPLIVESSPKLPAWRKAVADAVNNSVEMSGDYSKFAGAVRVEAVFYLKRPKTVIRLYPTKPPDLDKLCRSLMDGIGQAGKTGNGIWLDDSQVVEIRASKRYAEGLPGVAVTITPLI